MTLEERFWPKVDRSAGPNGCWPWMASRVKGYGHFGVGSRTDQTNKLVIAHRLAWILTHGPVPDGICVCHTCDNPPCCNPAHLWLGTHADNAADREAKGRGNQARGDANGARLRPERLARGDANGSRLHPESRPRGDDNGMRKDPEQRARAEAIRAASGTGVEIAARFGVSKSQVSRIRNGTRWGRDDIR